MNMNQIMNIMKMMNISSSQEELQQKLDNMTPEEKEKVNQILQSEEFKLALKSNDFKTIATTIKKLYTNLK